MVDGRYTVHACANVSLTRRPSLARRPRLVLLSCLAGDEGATTSRPRSHHRRVVLDRSSFDDDDEHHDSCRVRPRPNVPGDDCAAVAPPPPSAHRRWSDPLYSPPAAGPSGDPSAAMPPGAEVVTVASITDGDTLDVRADDGSVFEVRVIGTNTPESGECFSDEATRVLAALAPPGSRIGMTSDVSDIDQFDRLLRYLWVGAMSINEETVRRGAALSRSYPPDTAMTERFDDAQAAAKEAELGLWSPTACGPRAEATLGIVEVMSDAPGNDNENLNGEWIAIRNEGETSVDLTGLGHQGRVGQPPVRVPRVVHPSSRGDRHREDRLRRPISTPICIGATRDQRCGTTAVTPPSSSIPTATPTSPTPIRGDRRRRPNCTDAGDRFCA